MWGGETFSLEETQEIHQPNVLCRPYIYSNSITSMLLCMHTIVEELWTITGYFIILRILFRCDAGTVVVF